METTVAQDQSARRVVLLGASAGGVDAISTVVGGLAPGLPAAVLVVLHVPASGNSVLPAILSRAGPLPARHAVDGERLLEGRVYVAPPDHHLVTADGQVRTTRSPKENGVRPAVDTLFRAAARSHGRNVVAVVLSGTLDDGTAGLVAVKAHGGVTIAQDPTDAAFPSMPENAVRFAHPDHVLPVHEVAAVVSKYVSVNDREAAWPAGVYGVRATQAGPETAGQAATAADQPGMASGLNCPECGGSLWEQVDGGLLRFRCRVGHAYSPDSLFSGQLDSLEGALWSAVVGLHERADLAERLARRMVERGQRPIATRYEGQAADARRRADQIREAIVHLSRSRDPVEHDTQSGV
ncbi:MAG: chemotaxis protein CheB [Acidimicrobiales bacterium]